MSIHSTQYLQCNMDACETRIRERRGEREGKGREGEGKEEGREGGREGT